MRKLCALLALLLFPCMASCELANDTTSVKGEIQVLVKQFAEVAQKDVNAMLAMYEQGPGTVSVGNGQVERGIEAIRKNADTNLVGAQGKLKVDIGSIEVVPLGTSYAVSLTPFVLTDPSSPVFGKQPLLVGQSKGISTLIWKKTPEGWRVIHEHESYQLR
jgi:ketosteroid isomerase-like protein